MKIEAGKRYVLNNGEVTGGLTKNRLLGMWSAETLCWDMHGAYLLSAQVGHDGYNISHEYKEGEE